MNPETTKNKSPNSAVGPMIGIIIILIVVIVGAVYFWGKHIINSTQNTNATTTSVVVQTTPDNLDLIEGELNSTASTTLDLQ
ncbi:MAG: hypothetical protein WCW14_00455 [Candidatus Paceibacterota bacterium]|jgi:hypothetical protein